MSEQNPEKLFVKELRNDFVRPRI